MFRCILFPEPAQEVYIPIKNVSVNGIFYAPSFFFRDEEAGFRELFYVVGYRGLRKANIIDYTGALSTSLMLNLFQYL